MKIVTIVGARPQFIKAAPVTRAIERHNVKSDSPEILEILVHTGQHYDYNMSQIFFDQLGIRQPKYHLGVGSGKHGEMTGAMLARIEEVLLKEAPDRVLVYGDTNSTLAGALAAVKLHVPVAHVEAGLRSFNRRMPEEINRVLTDHVSDILFCPTGTAVTNLEKEGISSGVFKVGDVMYDTFLFNKKLATQKPNILTALQLKPRSYCLATVHREENTKDFKRLSSIFSAFNELAGAHCPFVIPAHPRTKKALQWQKLEDRLNPHVRVIPPVSYLDMIALESHARVILTDSGGIQKEAYFAQVPCITLRDETEWVELVKHGCNVVAGPNSKKICAAYEALLEKVITFSSNLYGNGDTSQKILHVLTEKTN